uniref:Major facilitator superfamily (MFS) profile domain-containing protein n=1 Tax=Panagrolaimus davidi TaxID=227884 RepID=A0A914PLN5_9BILA
METDDVIVKRVPKSVRIIVVVAAGVLLQFTYGTVYTFGNLLPYLVSYLRWQVDATRTSGSMIWLQSFMNGVPFSMLFGGYLERKIGARKSIFIGSLIYT